MLVQGHVCPATKGYNGSLQCTGLSGVPKSCRELSHSSFYPGSREWSLKTEHAGGCFEGRLEYGALSLGTGRESKNVKGV